MKGNLVRVSGVFDPSSSYKGSTMSLGFKTFENRGRNIIEIGHDFYDIWWLLKEPFVLAVNPQSEFTCCWCTWSQPWFLH